MHSTESNPTRPARPIRRTARALGGLALIVALADPAWGAAYGPAVGAGSPVRAAASPPREKKLTLEQLMADPPKCLKRSGFGHVAKIKRGMWQATIGQEPRTKVKFSGFVQGPFRSIGAATSAARKDSLVELAFAGGPFVVTATHASYLNEEISLAAACLASLTETSNSF